VNGNRLFEFRGNYIFDMQQNRVAEIRGDYFYDTFGNRMGMVY